MIQRINGIDRPELIRVGQKLKVLTGPRHVLVDKSDFRLALLIDGDFIKEYPVGLGKNNETPTGRFKIDKMLIEPDWYPPWGGVVKYGEEGHLIGDRWIGLGDQPGVTGYGIHGTSDPDSIGTLCSNGCIRMHNKDVKELYAFVNPGTTVEIVE
jgi:lipoprotein-anchoring transpeptidase ErfK/SrfK